MSSIREIKLKLWKENPHCHWCGELTDITLYTKGKIPKNAATVDHLYSKYDLRRWVKRKDDNERRKVLACSGCNNRRSIYETSLLSPMEKYIRGKGFSTNPRRTFDTIEEVIEFLQKKSVDLTPIRVNVSSNEKTTVPNG